MDNPKPEKVAVVTEVRERLGSAAGALLTEYRGLSVADMARLRRSLREAGGEYKVYKNTLVRFAVRDLGLDELEELLTGPTAIAFVDGDPAAVAKALRDFSRVNPNLVVKGGLLGGNVLSAQRAGALAELPSREVLLSRLAGALAAPMQQLAGLFQALPRNLAYGLKALIDQGGASGAPGASPAEVPAAETTEETTEEAAEAAEAAAPRVDEVSDGAEAATEATATEPTATEPTATEPTATEPTATEPTASEPAASEPAASEPAATELPVSEETPEGNPSYDVSPDPENQSEQ